MLYINTVNHYPSMQRNVKKYMKVIIPYLIFIASNFRATFHIPLINIICNTIFLIERRGELKTPFSIPNTIGDTLQTDSNFMNERYFRHVACNFDFKYLKVLELRCLLKSNNLCSICILVTLMKFISEYLA